MTKRSTTTVHTLHHEISARMAVDDVATITSARFELNKQSLTKLPILNDKPPSPALTPKCLLMRIGVKDSDIEASRRLVEHTNPAIEANASRQLATLPVLTPSTSSESAIIGRYAQGGGKEDCDRVCLSSNSPLRCPVTVKRSDSGFT